MPITGPRNVTPKGLFLLGIGRVKLVVPLEAVRDQGLESELTHWCVVTVEMGNGE